MAEDLANAIYWSNGEIARVLATERDGIAKHPELQRVPADSRTRKFDLGALYETQHHESLYNRIGAIDGRNYVSYATLECCKCHRRVSHYLGACAPDSRQK